MDPRLSDHEFNGPIVLTSARLLYPRNKYPAPWVLEHDTATRNFT